MLKSSAPVTVDEYISRFPVKVQLILKKLRKTIKAAAPEAEEVISYQMPAYKFHGILVYFAGHKNHIGFYPVSSAIKAFMKELSVYEGSKGTVRFPIDQAIPVGLITKMVKFRVKETLEKEIAKKNNKAIVKPVKSKKLSDEEQVKAYMSKLDPEAKREIDAVRKIIKAANSKIGERIKWNAPSYYYKEDILTFGPYKSHKLLLVFHHPAVVKIKSGLLEGNYKDRRLLYFKNTADAKAHQKELSLIINEIIESIDNK